MEVGEPREGGGEEVEGEETEAGGGGVDQKLERGELERSEEEEEEREEEEREERKRIGGGMRVVRDGDLESRAQDDEGPWCR